MLDLVSRHPSSPEVEAMIVDLARVAPEVLVEVADTVGADTGLHALVQHAVACTPGREQAEALIRISRAPSRWRSDPLRARERHAEAATMLASAQPREIVLELLDPHGSASDDADFELSLLVAHELVLLQPDVALAPVQQRIFAEAERRAHPLSVLPPRLLPIEHGWLRTRYSLHGRSCIGGWRPWEFTRSRLSGAAASIRVDDLTVKQDRTLIGEAFADVEQLTGGDLEIGVFSIEPAAPADPVALLGALPLDYLRGARELEWCGADAAKALAMLYAFAAYGAEGNVGMGGPRGRLHAWRSLAGLVGIAPGSPLPEIEARANLCRLTWFRRVYEVPPQYEAALLCVLPSGQGAAVVAVSTGE